MSRTACWSLALALLGATGCELVAGLGDFAARPAGGAAGTGAGGTAGAGGSAASGGGGTGGQGGGISQPRASHSTSFGSAYEDTLRGLDYSNQAILIAGTHNGPITIGVELPNPNNLGNDPFVARLSDSLAPAWAHSYDTEAALELGWLATGGGGPIRLVGWTVGAIDFGGGELAASFGNDAFLAQFDTGGGYQASKMWNESAGQFPVIVRAIGTGCVVAGYFQGTLNFGTTNDTRMIATDTDGFVARLTNAGDLVWSVQVTGPDDQEVRSVALDEGSDRAYVTGIYLKEDAGVIKADVGQMGTAIHHGPSDFFDSYLVALDLDDGTCLDQITFTSDDNVIARDLALSDDGLVLAGSFDGELTLGTETYQCADSGGAGGDGFVVKITPNPLTPSWSRHFPGTHQQIPNAVAIDSAGNVVVVGRAEDSIDFGSGPILCTDDGEDDAFVVKLAGADGHTLWGGVYGGPGVDRAWRVCTDALAGDQNVIVAGEFAESIDFGLGAHQSHGSSDVFVAKFLPNPLGVVQNAASTDGRAGR